MRPWRFTACRATARTSTHSSGTHGRTPSGLIAALDEFGFGAPARQLDVEAWLARGRTLELGRPPNQIHILTRISGVTFDEALEGHVASAYGRVPVRYMGLNALIRNKLAAARPKDLADVAALQRPRPLP